MDHPSQQKITSQTVYALDGSQVPISDLSVVNIADNTDLKNDNMLQRDTIQMTTLSSEIDEQTEWTIPGDNNTVISFRSLPLHLDQLDSETQLAIRQNLLDDPNNPTTESLIAYDGNCVSEKVANRFVSIANGESGIPNVDVDHIDGSHDNQAVLLLHQGVVEADIIDSINQASELEPVLTPPQTLIFCRVSVTISTEVMEKLPNYESIIWQEVEFNPNVQMEVTQSNNCMIHGCMDTIIKINNKLQTIINGKYGRKFYDHIEGDEKEKDVVGVQCDILVPHISSRGRLVHQPSRYTGFFKDPASDNEYDNDDEHRHKTKRRYYRVKKTAENNDPENTKLPERILKPFKFSCHLCSFKTLRQSHYQRHLKFHENRNLKLHKCKKCTFVAICGSHLNRHELQHSTTLHICDQCTYSTNQPHYLRRHKRYKHNVDAQNKILKCQLCNFQTTKRVNFNHHEKLHHPPVEKKMYECENCRYKTDVHSRYQRHMTNVHLDVRPYLCDDCGKSFKRPDALKAHKVTHMQRQDRVLPYVCETCSKCFPSKAHLKEHQISHRKDRPYLCHLCGASFKTQSVQKKHLTTIHINPRSFTCDICQKGFNTRFTLTRHKRTHESPAATYFSVRVASNDLQITPTGNETVEATDQPLVQDVIGENVEEPFDQSDSLRQTYAISSNETNAALFYLTENLSM